MKGRKEWFYIRNDFELAYVINTIKNSIQYINKYNINDYEHLKEMNTELDTECELKEICKDNELKQQIQEEISQKIKHNAQQFTNKTGNYKGVCWCKEKLKWKAELKQDYKIAFLGYFDLEIQAAKAYNDYALFLNQTSKVDYSLNDIENYTPNAKNIPDENKQIQNDKKTSKYNGVSYDDKRNYYVVSI